MSDQRSPYEDSQSASEANREESKTQQDGDDMLKKSCEHLDPSVPEACILLQFSHTQANKSHFLLKLL